MSQLVQFEEKLSESRQGLGIITINNPSKFNVHNRDMIRAMHGKLNEWEQNPQITAVFLQGAGDQAFCAGGDVRHIRELVQSGQSDTAFAYFDEEYALDHYIHRYGKPVIVWGNGVVMGGGLGLMIGASHRIVTSSTRMAMPESLIGFFPDVGMSYFLNQLPFGLGKFLAYTGVSFNASDALFLKWADFFVEQKYQLDIQQALVDSLTDTDENSHDKITSVLIKFQEKSTGKPIAQLSGHTKLIGFLTKEDVESFVIKSMQWSIKDSFLNNAQSNLVKTSPLSLKIIEEQLTQAREKTLQECFDLDRRLVRHFLGELDFVEGVRATLVDKDKNPVWRYAKFSDIPSNTVGRFFN